MESLSTPTPTPDSPTLRALFAAPVHPGDHDLDYRRERVARAVHILAEETAAARRRLIGRYTPAELDALWPEIAAGLAARLTADLPRAR